MSLPVSDPAPHFRTRMSAALRRDSIHGWYARPRDFYAALFALDTSLDDESFTAAMASITPCEHTVWCSALSAEVCGLRHFQLTFYPPITSLAHFHPERKPPRRSRPHGFCVNASTSCMYGLTWIMQAPKGLEMQTRMLGFDVASTGYVMVLAANFFGLKSEQLTQLLFAQT